MRTLHRMVMLAAAAGLAAGCGDDNGGTQNTQLNVVGNWRATKWEVSMVADPSVRIDIVGGGATIQLTLTAGGTFTLTQTFLGESETVTGTWTLSGTALTLTAEDEPLTFVIGSNRTTMNLLETHMGFDFDDCGQDEEAHFNATMVRE